MKSSAGILRLVPLLLAVNIAIAIKCWDCRSDEDIKCADPFDNSSLPMKDCSTVNSPPHLPNLRANLCRKIRQKVNGEWRYFRSCAFLGEPGIANDERFCIMRTGTYNIFIEYCNCNTKDGCNSAPSTAVGSQWVVWITTLCGTAAVYLLVK